MSMGQAEAAMAELAPHELVALLVPAPGQGAARRLLLLVLARLRLVPHVQGASAGDVLVHLAVRGFVEIEANELAANGALWGRVLHRDVDVTAMVALLSVLDAKYLRAVLAFERQEVFRLALSTVLP